MKVSGEFLKVIKTTEKMGLLATTRKTWQTIKTKCVWFGDTQYRDKQKMLNQLLRLNFGGVEKYPCRFLWKN